VWTGDIAHLSLVILEDFFDPNATKWYENYVIRVKHLFDKKS